MYLEPLIRASISSEIGQHVVRRNLSDERRAGLTATEVEEAVQVSYAGFKVDI